ncbi:autophagy protein Apg5-domain-containing protein [Terfezia claveryi]|nr:autophagy protein Apg5-domain-containing protein [Terfezia claveryi]
MGVNRDSQLRHILVYSRPPHHKHRLPHSPHSHQREPTTVGTVLRTMVPELFLSTRANRIAKPVLHGIVIPLNTPLVELMKEASYPDGFLHVAVAMMS